MISHKNCLQLMLFGVYNYDTSLYAKWSVLYEIIIIITLLLMIAVRLLVLIDIIEKYLFWSILVNAHKFFKYMCKLVSAF